MYSPAQLVGCRAGGISISPGNISAVRSHKGGHEEDGEHLEDGFVLPMGSRLGRRRATR